MARPSDQWLKKEDVNVTTGDIALEASTAEIGFATVAVGAGKSYIGLATVTTHGYSGIQYTSNTTGAIKSGAGVLHSISIHKASCPTISLWDSTVPSGTKIMDIPPNLTVGSHYIYDINFATGLTVQGTAGVAPNVIISYR